MIISILFDLIMKYRSKSTKEKVFEIIIRINKIEKLYIAFFHEEEIFLKFVFRASSHLFYQSINVAHKIWGAQKSLN